MLARPSYEPPLLVSFTTNQIPMGFGGCSIGSSYGKSCIPGWLATSVQCSTGCTASGSKSCVNGPYAFICGSGASVVTGDWSGWDENVCCAGSSFFSCTTGATVIPPNCSTGSSPSWACNSGFNIADSGATDRCPDPCHPPS